MYAVLPKGSKPSKSASRDTTRPVLTHGELRETSDGWELVTCDSYQLARVKLSVHDDDTEPLTPGAISLDALKAVEKAGGFRANGSVEPCNHLGTPTGMSFARTEPGTFPKWDSLMPEPNQDAFRIGLDAELLYQLAQSLGAKQHSKTHVTLTFVTDADGKPNALRPFTVHAKDRCEGVGMRMPVRVN